MQGARVTADDASPLKGAMVGRFFLLPLLAMLGWYLYLRWRGFSLMQGLRGFIWIFISSSLLAALFALLLWLTR